MADPRVVPRAEHSALAPRHRSRRPEGPLSPAPVRPHRVSRRRQRPRSAARPAAERFRHRHVRASLSGQEAVPELLDHRPAVPPGARQVRHEGHRGRHVPPAGGAGRRGGAPTACRRRIRTTRRRQSVSFTTTTHSARPRRTRSGATSRSTRCSTTSRRSRSSTTSAAWRISSARVVRSIGDPEVRIKEDPVRMLRAVALAARLDFTIDPPLADAIRAHRHEIARSSPPRLLEEYYKILRAGQAERTFREPGGHRPARTAIRPSCTSGAGDELWRIAGVARRLPSPVRIDAGDADEPDPARHADRAARHPAARASTCRRRTAKSPETARRA